MPYQPATSRVTTEDLFQDLENARQQAAADYAYANANRQSHTRKERDRLSALANTKWSAASVSFYTNVEDRPTLAGEWRTPAEPAGLEATRNMHYSGRNTHPQADKAGRESETRTAENLRALLLTHPQVTPASNPLSPAGTPPDMDPDLIRIRVAGDQPCDYCADTLRAVVEDWSAAYPNSRIELFGRDNNVRRDESQTLILVAEPGRVNRQTGQPTSSYGGPSARPATTPFGTEVIQEEFTRYGADRDPYHPITQPLYSLQRADTLNTYENQSSGSGSNRGHRGTESPTWSSDKPVSETRSSSGTNSPHSSGYAGSVESWRPDSRERLADQLQNLSVDNRHAPGPPAPSPYQTSFEAPVPTPGMPHHVSPVEFQHYLKFYTDHAQQYRLHDQTAIDRAARTATEQFARGRSALVDPQQPQAPGTRAWNPQASTTSHQAPQNTQGGQSDVSRHGPAAGGSGAGKKRAASP